MRDLIQSTARDITILMVAASDHVTGLAGLTLTIKTSKAGAALATITPTVTDLGSGVYKLALTSGMVDTLGDLAFHITGTAADPADWIDQVIVAPAASSDIATLLTRLSAARAGYLDNLSVGAVAQASTALSTAQWSNARAGYLDNLSVGAVAQAATALSTAQWTSARAGYLDNINVGGNVASSAEATSIQNNTRTVRVVPNVIERPDAGTAIYVVEILLYDSVGNMEAPDSAPTIALTNQALTDLSARLSATTMVLVSAGRYRVTYTADVAHDLEQLLWTFTVVEGGATRVYGNASIIVDNTAVDFTAADRTKLNTLATDYTTARAAYLDNLSAGAVAQAATALSTAQWSNVRAGYIDNLSAGAVAQAATALSTAQWSNTRAGYLDNLSGGAVALASALTTAKAVIDDIDERTSNLPDDPADQSIIINATNAIAAAVALVAAQLPAVLTGGFIKAKVMSYDTGLSPAPLVMQALTSDYSSVPGSLAEAIERPLGAVVADAGNTTLTFKTDITSADANAFKDAFVRFLDGALANQVHKITSSAATSGFLTFTTAFTSAPSDGDRFVLING